jgi:hypothetical protein
MVAIGILGGIEQTSESEIILVILDDKTMQYQIETKKTIIIRNTPAKYL